jgi:hypothetical protein
LAEVLDEKEELLRKRRMGAYAVRRLGCPRKPLVELVT